MGWFIGIVCIAALLIIVALGVISIKENAEEAAAKEAANRPMTSYGGRKITDTCECCGEHKETKLYLENGKTVREYCKTCADAARADGYVSLQALNVVKPAPDTPKNPDSSFSPPEPPEKPRKRVKIKKGTIIALCVVATILIAVVTLTVVFRRQISGFVYEKTGKCFYHIYYLKDDNSITYTQRAGDTKYHHVTYDYVCDICGKEKNQTQQQAHGTDYKVVVLYEVNDEKNHNYNKQSYCTQCGMLCEEEKSIEAHAYGMVKTEKAPTCADYGGSYRECSKCGERDWINKTLGDHIYEDLGETERSPICTICKKKAEGLFTTQFYKKTDYDFKNSKFIHRFYVKALNCTSKTISYIKATFKFYDAQGTLVYDNTMEWEPFSFSPNESASFDFTTKFLTDVSTYSIEYEIAH